MAGFVGKRNGINLWIGWLGSPAASEAAVRAALCGDGKPSAMNYAAAIFSI